MPGCLNKVTTTSPSMVNTPSPDARNVRSPASVTARARNVAPWRSTSIVTSVKSRALLNIQSKRRISIRSRHHGVCAVRDVPGEIDWPLRRTSNSDRKCDRRDAKPTQGQPRAMATRSELRSAAWHYLAQRLALDCEQRMRHRPDPFYRPIQPLVIEMRCSDGGARQARPLFRQGDDVRRCRGSWHKEVTGFAQGAEPELQPVSRQDLRSLAVVVKSENWNAALRIRGREFESRRVRQESQRLSRAFPTDMQGST